MGPAENVLYEQDKTKPLRGMCEIQMSVPFWWAEAREKEVAGNLLRLCSH